MNETQKAPSKLIISYLLELCMKKEFCTAGFKNGEDSEDVGNRNEQQNIYRTIPVEN